MNRLTVGLVVLALVAGCGQGGPDYIDRTQPNVFLKEDLLQGVWYWKETFVEGTSLTPGSQNLIGAGGRLEKVRFEIQENQVVGYRAYEVVPGADPFVDNEKSVPGKVVFKDGRPYKGNPVVAYPILSHFDIQRDYNRATGEQTNVLTENTTDRPWYERRYMRVDFRANVIQNFESCTPSGVTGSMFQCRPGYGTSNVYTRFIQPQDNRVDDSSVVKERDGNGKLRYFDITTEALLDPLSISFPNFGTIPFCLFNSAIECNGSVARIRVSFLRANEDRPTQYEPLVYGEKLMVKFGFFRNEQVTYDRDYRYTETGRQLYAMRHNIWMNNRGPEVDSNCNVRPNGNPLAVLPVQCRTPKPIIYYLSAHMPPEYLEVSTMRHAEAALRARNPSPTAAEVEQVRRESVEGGWDHAFRRAVAVPRGVEVAEIPQMFYICENPVPAGAPEACGREGTFVRMGDLRYNMVPFVLQHGGPLGFGPAEMDPETGEVVNSVAAVYATSLDTWAGDTHQVIKLINGQISIGDIISGADMRSFVLNNLRATDPRRPQTGPFTSTEPLLSDATRPLEASRATHGRLASALQLMRDTKGPPRASGDRQRLFERALDENPRLSQMLASLEEVVSATESISLNPGFQARVRADPKFRESVVKMMIKGEDPVQQLRDTIKRAPDPSVGCFYEYDDLELSYTDEDYDGIAQRKAREQRALVAAYKARGLSDADAARLADNDIYRSLKQEGFKSVAQHEIGHTVGLRHNFAGSADAVNYKDGYWDLRKETIGVMAGGQRVLPTTPANLQDAAKLNQRQRDEGMYEFAYSSIMDYPSRLTGTIKGLGKYDEAAVLFGYSGGSEPGWVEVFNQTRGEQFYPAVLDNQARTFAIRNAADIIPSAIAQHYTLWQPLYTDRYHYTTVPLQFADAELPLSQALDQGIARMNSRSFRPWRELEGYYSRLDQALVQFDLDALYIEIPVSQRQRFVLDQVGRGPVEVPYMFCSDGETGSNLMCNLWDQGADPYEMSRKWIERYNETYIFSNFRRDRPTMNPFSVALRKYARFLGNLPNVYQQWIFVLYGGSSESLYDRGVADPIYQNVWTMAVMDTTNLLMQQLSIPQVGYYGRKSDGSWTYVGDLLTNKDAARRNVRLETAAEAEFRNVVLSQGSYNDLVYIPRGQGRSMFSVYDETGHDAYRRVNEAGHYWDVFAAMIALSQSQTQLLGVDRGGDALRYSLPYYLIFNREISPLFAAYWTNKLDYFAPSIAKLPDGSATVRLPTYVNSENYIWNFRYPLAQPAPVDSTGSPMVMSKALTTPTWSSRFNAQLWSMAFFTANDAEYAERNKVFRLGSADALTPSGNFDVVVLPDPFGSGYQYAALKERQTVNPPTAAVEIVERAIANTAKWQQVCRVNTGTPAGQAVRLPCPSNANNRLEGLNSDEWEAVVREDVRIMEMMDGLYRIFGR